MSARRGNGEGSIYRRKDGRWAAAFTLESGQRKTLYGRTRGDVAQRLREALQNQSRGLPVTGDPQTVGDFLALWLQEAVATRVRPATALSYTAKIRHHINPAIGLIPLGKLSPRHVDRMLTEQLAQGYAPQSVRHHHAVLRNALGAAERWGLVARNVASLVTPPRVPRPDVQALTAADARAVLSTVRGDRLEALYLVGLTLGLRQSEALGLRWDDIDLDTGMLRVRRTLQRAEGRYQFYDTKSVRSRRAIALPRPLVQALKTHRARQGEERLRAGGAWEGSTWGHLVFTNRLGQPLHGASVTRRLTRLLRDAGLRTLRYHDLRHGAATLMAAQGVPARVAMEVLGHAHISTTMEIYAHVAPDLQREATERIAELLWASG